MQNRTSPLSPETWLQDLFACKAVQQGAVIRRKARDVHRIVGMDRFLQEINRRGYQAVENSGQIVIFCNRAPLRWFTPQSDDLLSFKESRTNSLEEFVTDHHKRRASNVRPVT